MPPKRKLKASSVEATDAEKTSTAESMPKPKRKVLKKKEEPIETVDEDAETFTAPKSKPKVQRKVLKEKKEPIETVDEDAEKITAPKSRPKIQRKTSKKKEDPIETVDEDAEKISAESRPKRLGRASKKKETPTQIVDEDAEMISAESRPKPAKRASKKKEAPIQIVDEDAEKISVESRPKPAKRASKKKEAPIQLVDEEEIEVKKPKTANKTTTNWGSIEYTCDKKNGEDKPHNLIISCWNVGGLRSWISKGCLEYLEHEKPDIFCMQETKCSKEKAPDEIKNLKLYKQYWCSSKKEGYAGVTLFTIKEPIQVVYGIDHPEMDEEGRCITAEYDQFFLVCVYVPNAGRKLVTLPKRLDWNQAFKEFVVGLEKRKPVIICGDMNVSHNEIDLARPATNKKNAGFTQEERNGMTDFLAEGFVDTFRELYPDRTDAYTFWTYMANARAKNIGWRLDYFITSKKIMNKVCDNVIRSEIAGSDHCPITLFININAEGPRATSK